MDRPTRIIYAGLITGLLLFMIFFLLTLLSYPVVSTALNNFLTMIGLILFFISGFFYVSMKTLNK